MTDLITRYRQLLDETATMFSNLMNKTGEWTSDYTLWCTEWEAWTPDNMLYILGKYGHLLQKRKDIADDEIRRDILIRLRNDVQAWLEYNTDVAQFHIQYINLKSWLMGAPRVSQEQIDHLRELRDSLNNTVEEYRAEYGELDTNPQPKHLRNIKTNK